MEKYLTSVRVELWENQLVQNIELREVILMAYQLVIQFNK